MVIPVFSAVGALAVSAWVVTLPVADMHSKPVETADVVSQAGFGATVSVVASRSGWRRVRTADGYEGWMLRSALVKSESGPYSHRGKVARVGNLFANLYREPDVTRQRPLLMIPFDSPLEILSEPESDERRWVEVRLPDGSAAWVQRGDLGFPTAPLSIPETITVARRLLGLPYRWGGTTTYGFDCSGLTQLLCRLRGVTIPRDSGPQARWDGMDPVSEDDLAPGDLVYFGESLERITHTGMYIGNREFVHATAFKRPMVQISSLDESHWADLLVACRRLRTRQTQ